MDFGLYRVFSSPDRCLISFGIMAFPLMPLFKWLFAVQHAHIHRVLLVNNTEHRKAFNLWVLNCSLHKKKTSRVHGSLYVIAFVSASLPQRAVVIAMRSSPARRRVVLLPSRCRRMPVTNRLILVETSELPPRPAELEVKLNKTQRSLSAPPMDQSQHAQPVLQTPASK